MVRRSASVPLATCALLTLSGAVPAVAERPGMRFPAANVYAFATSLDFSMTSAEANK